MRYSTSFLRGDWTGAGLDLGFDCLFIEGEQRPVADWFEMVHNLYSTKDYIFRFTFQETEERAAVLGEHASPSESPVWAEQASVMAILKGLDEQESNAFLDTASPGELFVGADASMFFSGSRNTDRQFLEYLLKPVQEAMDRFGPAIIDFCSEAQIDFDRSKPLPIVRTREEAEVWVDRGLKVLDEIRQVEEADSEHLGT